MKLANLARVERKFWAIARSQNMESVARFEKDTAMDRIVLRGNYDVTCRGRSSVSMVIEGGDSHRVAMAKLLDFFDLYQSLVRYEKSQVNGGTA